MHKNWCDKKQTTSIENNNKNDSNNKKDAFVPSESVTVNEVMQVLNQIVYDVAISEEKGKDHLKAKRKKYTNMEKIRALDELDRGMMAVDVAERLGVNKSMITRWKQNADTIYTSVAQDYKRRLFTKNRKAGKHSKLFQLLFQKFESSRKQGKRCSHTWIYIQALKLFKQMYPNVEKPLSKSVISYFTRKYNIKCLRVQRRKQKDNKSVIPGLMKWHSNLREGLIKTGSEKPTYDKKWGRFPPSKRLNLDQIPLPFAVNVTKTYEMPISKEDRRYHRVWVKQPGSGLNKRQCTLQLAFGPETVIRPTLIFRGLGKRISKDEEAAYDKDVDVLFQANAWADTKVSENWVKSTLAKAVQNLDEYVLFCDNLVAQTSNEFKEAVRATKGIVWFGLANATNIWQPVDCGYGQLYKSQVALAQERWLEESDNVEKWHGNDGKSFTASDRRILLTHWVEEAHRLIATPQYNAVRYRCFQKTGCLITADGTDDEKIKPEGLEDCYVVPPSLDVASASEPIESEIEPREDPPDEHPEDYLESIYDADGEIFELLTANTDIGLFIIMDNQEQL